LNRNTNSHVVGQVRDVNRSLVGSEQPTFGQRGDAVNSGQQVIRVLFVGACGALTVSLMDVADLVETAVSLPTVSDHGRARLDVVDDKGM
jgi:hypothetical protein